MRKFEKIQILKNVGSSWFSLGINVLTGVLLSPFILHHLGDSAYGVWVLIFSVTGYYGIFDLGIRSSIVRYVAKYRAVNDRENLAKLVNTALFTYSCIGAASMLATLVVSFCVNALFRVPPELYTSARWLLLMVGCSVSLGFPLGVFGGVLEGLQRFYILNWTNVASTLLRATLIVYFLHRGGGLLTVAAITVGLPLMSSVLRGLLAMRLLNVSLSLRHADRATFKTIATYSSVTFMVLVAAKLRFQTDEMVIGGLLSTAAITYFSIGARIVDYASEVVTSLAQIFVPLSSHSDATGDTDRLRKILVAGNRACAFIIFPISAILLILGKSVIEVWVGAKYVAPSYPVLVILIVPFTLMLAQAASGRILFGMSQHRTLGIVTLVEGVANLVLSILLVRPYGIVGDALGTAIPLTCTTLLFMPAHLCKKLDLRVGTFLREAYTLPTLLNIPFIASLLLLRHWYVAHNYRQLGLQMLTCGVVYALCLLWAHLSGNTFRMGTLTPEEQSA